jgi:SprA family protein
MIISSYNFSNQSLNAFRIHRSDLSRQAEASVIDIDRSRETAETKKKQAEIEDTSFTNSNSKQKIESELNQQEVNQLRELRQRDREVRAHEQAHAAVAGSLAKGGPSFSYQRGADGQLYAIGGEVQIDTSAVADDPEATAEKARQVRRAALAPAQPSQQDRSVAAAASAIEAQARVEIAQQKTEDSVKKLSARFSNEQNHVEKEQADEVGKTVNTEVHSKCAQCGGQHSAESHVVAVSLEETFSQNEPKEQKERLFDIAI